MTVQQTLPPATVTVQSTYPVWSKSNREYYPHSLWLFIAKEWRKPMSQELPAMSLKAVGILCTFQNKTNKQHCLFIHSKIAVFFSVSWRITSTKPLGFYLCLQQTISVLTNQPRLFSLLEILKRRTGASFPNNTNKKLVSSVCKLQAISLLNHSRKKLDFDCLRLQNFLWNVFQNKGSISPRHELLVTPPFQKVCLAKHK